LRVAHTSTSTQTYKHMQHTHTLKCKFTNTHTNKHMYALTHVHLNTQCFEGLKAFHGVDGKIRLFRPMENLKRMNNSAIAASLPVSLC